MINEGLEFEISQGQYGPAIFIEGNTPKNIGAWVVKKLRKRGVWTCIL